MPSCQKEGRSDPGFVPSEHCRLQPPCTWVSFALQASQATPVSAFQLCPREPKNTQVVGSGTQIM